MRPSVRWLLALGWLSLLAPPLRAQPEHEDLPPVTPGPPLELAEALRLTEARNPTVELLRAEIARADARLSQAWALVIPGAQASVQWVHADHPDRVDMGASLNESLGPILEGMGVSLPPTESEPITVRPQETVTGSAFVGVGLIHPQGWAAIRLARRGVDLARLGADEARQQLRLGVAQAWLMALMNRSLVELQAAQVVAARHHLAVARDKLAAGTGLRLDAVRAETDLEEARQQHLAALLALDTARDALAVLTGTEGLPLPTSAPDLAVPGGDEAALVRQGLDARLDLRLARARIEVADLGVHAAWMQFVPSVDAAWAGTYQFTELGDFGSQDRLRWNTVLTLNVPIFTWFRYGDLAEKRAALRIARLKDDLERREASREIRQARRDHLSAQASVRIADRQAALAGEALELALRAYEAGAGPALVVTDARRARAAADVSLATQTLRARLALLALRRALGLPLLP